MNIRFWFALIVVISGLTALVASGVNDTSKRVVTVAELIETKSAEANIRLGARVTEDPIEYRTSPDFFLRFNVRDIAQAGTGSIPVEYDQMMPNTLQAGRDVILEGNFNGKTFYAKTLLTQCPSKYEPPLPGSDKQREKVNG